MGDPLSAQIRQAIADAIRPSRPAAGVSYTGAMAIAALYLQEQLGPSVTVVCGLKFLAEIERLERMTLAERIAERDIRPGGA